MSDYSALVYVYKNEDIFNVTLYDLVALNDRCNAALLPSAYTPYFL